DIKTGAYLLTGQVKDVHSSGRAVCDFGQVTPGRLLTQWIHHLAYCAVVELPGPTQLIGRDPDKRKPAVVFEFAPVKEQAGSLIEKLVRYFRLGSTRTLPFFCTPCFHLVKDLSKREYDLDDASLEKALSKAGALWSGNNFVAGEVQNRYTSLVFKDINPFANLDTLRQSGALDIGLSIFKPMLENMNT
ncbi:MAG: exodeoxyribonuclease V subunit gamma, partial [Desulfobacterales bacterium]|nr:exodeoxyribonuclease V subunit gamma [Desulfobacterales bacterium]